MSLRLAAVTVCLALALLASGCSSKPSSTNTSGAETSGGATSGATSGSTGSGSGGSGGNATGAPQTFSCTSIAGGTGSGYSGAGGQYVGGCPFGQPTTTATLLMNATLPAGCDPYYASGSVSTNAQPAKVGESYPTGTQYSMFCGPGGIQLTGTIQISAT